MTKPDPVRLKEKIEAVLARAGVEARAFAERAQKEAGLDLERLIDPDGEAVLSLVDGEVSSGAASLAMPMELITFETWLLGHLGDHDALDFDVGAHEEIWFALGAWLSETLRARHGGFWLIGGEDPRAWRVGFSKVLLEIAPHAFAERLLRAGHGCAQRMLAEIERLRVLHEAQAESEQGRATDKYTPQHYARIHSVPLAQWFALDLARVRSAWTEGSVTALRALILDAGKRLPPQNAPVVAKLHEHLGSLDGERPAAAQSVDRGLFEAVAQVLAMRRGTSPIAADVLEKVVMPALHVGVPETFPPLDQADVERVKQGIDLFALWVDVVPYAHPGEDGGFLGSFSPTELGTPYPDRRNLEVGKGDWLVVNPVRLRPMLAQFDAARLLARFDAFVEYVRAQPGAPRASDTGRGLVETAARAIADLQATLAAAGQVEGGALVFRLLPPPS